MDRPAGLAYAIEMRRLVLLSELAVTGMWSAQFEAASIKPASVPVNREGGNRSKIEHTPTTLRMWNVSVNECVQWAYGVMGFQVSEAHASSDSWDILATAGRAVPVSEMRVMLQDLLAQRFRLVLHREQRMLPVNELVVTKGGPKLPPAKPASQTVHSADSLPRVRDDAFVFADATLADFAMMFGKLRGIDLPVIDHTGIAGTFDIVLKGAPAAARDGDGGALFALVQEQLGLKVAAAKVPFEVLVIDRVQRPAEN